MPEIINSYTPTPTQAKAHAAKARYKLFGGAMGGGKTRWLCEEAKELSIRYPGNRGVMCRYHLQDFKNSTLKLLLEVLPPELIRTHNQAEHTIYLHNNSEIIYFGLSEPENVSKLKSMEIGWFAIDEASEVSKEHFLLFQSRLRRLLPDKTHPPFYGLLATNPADCWLKDDFVLGGGGSDYLFIPSLPKDNPFLPEDYEAQLRKTYPEDWVRIFLEGSWDDLELGDICIPMKDVRMAVSREIELEDKSVLGCDIARFGEDEIVIYWGMGNCIMEQDVTNKKSLMETVGRIVNWKEKKNVKLIATDDAALGGGVTDRLREMKMPVFPINGGSKATSEKFANLKSEMWWYARELFKAGKVSIINDPVLIRQLSAVRYIYRSNGKIMVEPKKEVKARLGRSPDRAEAFILMLWGAKHLVDPAKDFKRAPISGFEEGYKNPYGWSYHQGFTNEVLQ